VRETAASFDDGGIKDGSVIGMDERAAGFAEVVLNAPA